MWATDKKRVYLDHNATTPVRPEVLSVVCEAMSRPGNASSVHTEGRSTRLEIETARDIIAERTGSEASGIVFTSGGTEANIMALTNRIELDGHWTGVSNLFVSAGEHASVMSGGQVDSAKTIFIPINSDGIVDLEILEKQLKIDAKVECIPLVSIQFANNETGVVQSVSDIARIVHAAGGILHVDAVQAFGKISLDIEQIGADFMTLSSHKIGGPPGAGALVRRRGAIGIPALLKGGGQERNARAGTENAPAIIGFGKAADLIDVSEGSIADIRSKRDGLLSELMRISPDAVIHGHQSERLPNTLCYSVPGIEAETAVIALDLEGISISAGSACSSGKVGPSHVLAAMGVSDDLARGGMRISLGWSTTNDDLRRFIQTWQSLVNTQLSLDNCQIA